MSNETNLNAAQNNHIFYGKGGKMYKRISFVLAAALVVNLSGMVAPGRAQQVTTVPDVVGMTEAAAESAIYSCDLRVRDISYEYSDTVLYAQVISQDPEAGTWVFSGTTVDLVICGPQMVEVPDVVGMSQADAESEITSAGLIAEHAAINPYLYSDTVPAGHVIRQDPAGGTSVCIGASVGLVICEKYKVPNVVGMTEAAARGALSSRHLSVANCISREYSDTVPEGRIISQDPEAGTWVRRNYTVDLVICGSQMVDVPDVVGMYQWYAEQAIHSNCWLVSVISRVYSATVAEHYVISQDPPGGTSVPIGSSVDLTISQGPPGMVEVPDVVGMMAYPYAIEEIYLRDLVCAISLVCVDTGDDGYVISQDPAAGTVVAKGSTVWVTVSEVCPPDQQFVPGVVGRPEAAAKSAITTFGLVYAISRVYSDTVAEGYVISQDPPGGTSVPIGSSVDLTISQGPPGMVEVPDVVGMMAYPYAIEEIYLRDLVCAISLVCVDTGDDGYVISQDPAAGTVVAKGSTVWLNISMYCAPRVGVPDVVGMSRAAAESEITSAGLVVGTIGHENSDTVPEGFVISQDPAGGTSVPIGSSVNLTISLGPWTVPDVVGMSESDAASTINSAELSVGSIGYLYSDTVPAGCVISQYPRAGTVVDSGSKVDLDISMGPDTGGPTVEVPDVVGMTESDAKSVITSASLNVGTISNDYSDTVPKGFVISQSPSGGTSVSEGYSVILTISLGPEPGDVPPVPVPPDASCLLAHWKLDDGSGNTAIDSSDNDFDITLHNTTWEDGLFGDAVHFQGVGYGVGNFSYTGNAITVSAWVWHDAFIIGKIERYVTVGLGGAVISKESDARLHFYIKTDDNLQHLRVSDVLREGQWHHVAGTWDGLNQRLYIDGVEIASQVSDGVLGDTSAVMISSDGNESFNGMLDDVRIYDCALDENQIKALASGLLAHWKLDEIEGAIAYDSSGNGNHGILYGDPTWQPTGGIIDGTLEFDGDGDYVEIPKIGDIVEFTYAMWVAQNQVDSGLIALIDHNDWVYGSVQFELRDGHPKVGINGAITPAGDLDAWGHTLAAGEWHHVALAKSATELLMYVDGEEAARRELITSDTVILGDGFIGAWVNPTWGQTRYFDGWLDDVRIYDCVLDENQIKALISAPPSPSPLNPLSEALDTSLSFTTGGSADWFSQTTTSYHDGDAAQSEDISDDQESWMQTTVSGKGTVKFYWKVSSEDDFDCLEFYIDGALEDQISGSVNWQQKTYTISTSGSHTLEWRYMKDGVTGYGSDCGWVDKVEWITTP